METKYFTKWLRGKMASEGLKQSEVADWICLSQPALSEKLKNGRFSLQEAIIIFEKFQATDEEVLRCMRWDG